MLRATTTINLFYSNQLVWMSFMSLDFSLLNDIPHFLLLNTIFKKTLMITMATQQWSHRKRTQFISSIEHSFNPWVICHHLKLFQPLMRCTFIPKWFFELNEHHCDANCMWEWTEIRELRSLCATLSFGQPNKCNYVFCNHFHCHRFARMLLKVPQTRKWIFGLNVWKYSHLNVRTKLHDKWLQTIFTIFSSTSIFVSLEQILIEGNVLHFQNDINS